ncbi:hypothetical protein V825_01113 [Staphylococcus aureus T86792]|nr:hypothetical protein V825_01113 [Staphylococcus aureus T86792]
MIFDRHANLKYRYGNRKFWCKGFYVDTVGRNIHMLVSIPPKLGVSSFVGYLKGKVI